MKRNPDSDRLPGRCLPIDPFHFASERYHFQQQAADVAVAETGYVAQLGGSVEDFNGEGVMRVLSSASAGCR